MSKITESNGLHFSLVNPSILKIRTLSAGDFPKKLEARFLAILTGVFMPIGDAIVHTSFAIAKVPFLAEPLKMGKLIGYSFVLDPQAPRKSLMKQIALHVTRAVASLFLTALSTVTLLFVLMMPRLVTHYHHELGLGFKRERVITFAKVEEKPKLTELQIIAKQAQKRQQQATKLEQSQVSPPKTKPQPVPEEPTPVVHTSPVSVASSDNNKENTLKKPTSNLLQRMQKLATRTNKKAVALEQAGQRSQPSSTAVVIAK